MRIGDKTYWNSFVSVPSGLTIPEMNALASIFNNGIGEEVQSAEVGDISNPEAEAAEGIRRSKVKWLQYEDFVESGCVGIDQKIVNKINEINDTYFKFDLSHIEPFQLTQYDASEKGKYDFHTDSGSMQDNILRKLSFIIPLVPLEQYEGGHLQFMMGSKELTDVTKDKPEFAQAGMIIAFPSHVLHAITPVTKGTRYSLVGWCNGPRFK